jgi:hypothetical protein
LSANEGTDAITSVDKGGLLAALKAFLAAEIAQAKARLAIKDSGEDAIRLSDCTGNLRALERMDDPERSMLVIETEENEFYLEQLTSTRRHLDLVVKVPYPLSGLMTVQAREYRLARHTEWHEALKPGAEFHGHPRRDERWRSQMIVRAMA